MSYADIGLTTIAGLRDSGSHDSEFSTQDSTGWTTPTLIWERMKQIDLSADSLNASIKGNVKDPSFIARWGEWYKHWKGMMDKYDSWSAKLAAATYSDDLAVQIENERQILLGWYRDYDLEGQKQGQPLPKPPGGPPPNPDKPPPSSNKPPGWIPSLEVPWWAWALGIAAVAGLGALVYHRIKVTREDPRMREMLDRYGPPSTAQIDAARIEAMRGASSYLGGGRDPSEDIRYQIGGGYGARMCPCPGQVHSSSPVFDPE